MSGGIHHSGCFFAAPLWFQQQVPRYRSAMMECSPRSQKSGKSGKGSPEKKQTRRQRTAMLLADGTPKATANAARMEHSRTDTSLDYVGWLGLG